MKALAICFFFCLAFKAHASGQQKIAFQRGDNVWIANIDGTTAKWKLWSARIITKEKKSQFIVTTRKRLKLYFLWLAVPNTDFSPSCI